MKIVFNNTIKDVFLFNLYALKLFPNNLIYLGLPGFISAWFVSETGSIFSPLSPIFIFLTVYTIGFIIMAVVVILVIGIFTAMNINNKNSKSILCEHRLIFDNDLLIEETEYNRSEFNWNAIYKVQETKSYIRIFISKLQAFLIPKAQLNEKELLGVLEFLKTKNVKTS